MKGLSPESGIVRPMPTLLVRYGEVGLKSKRVRRRFEGALVADIRRKHVLAGVQCLISEDRGRIFVDSDDWRRSCEILSRTFGVVSFSPSTKVGSRMEELKAESVRFADQLLCEGATFAVRARRTGDHPYGSQDVCEEVGSALLSAYSELGLRVDLDEPDVTVFIEVRGPVAYLYSSVIPGPGGMPKDTQGRVLSVVESERGVAASWLLMKRGCTVVAMCGEEDSSGALRSWDADLATVEPAEDFFAAARMERCLGVVLERGVGDIGERGLPLGDLPVFYPLMGMVGSEVDGLLARITRV